MDRARVLAAQGANSVLDTNGRQSLAQEAQSLLEQMVACSRTAVQGRYIFSGDRDDAPSYQARSDVAHRRRTASLHGGDAADRRSRRADRSRRRKTAQEIFDSRNPADGTPAADKFCRA